LLATFKIEEAFADEEKAPDYNVAPTSRNTGGGAVTLKRCRYERPAPPAG
jgi:hypothetical protein